MIIGENTIVNENAVNSLAKNYNILDYPVKLSSLLKDVYPSSDFDNFSKYDLHKALNDTIIQNYDGEEILKYKLFEQHINKRNLIAAFEVKVNASRVDFLAINGSTTSFEIKSKLDNLSKLSKQMADYMLAFEYNYVVIDERHVEKAKLLLPASYGLLIYKEGRCEKLRKAKLNDKLDPKVQLGILTKRELTDAFPKIEGGLNHILNFYDIQYINRKFKKVLKERYRSRWEFLISNRNSIFPIDIQFFFNTNIQPSHIY